jgi:DNA polymerase elongation subunit (family B)
MYQSIYYSYSGEDKGTCYLRDDKKQWSSFKYYPTVYKLDPDGEYKTLFGDYCSPVKGKFDWHDPSILEKDIQKEIAILRDLYYKDDSPPVNHNTIYLDIEIEILGTLTPQSIREANAKVTSIALIDVNTGKKYCYILDEKQVIKHVDKDNKEIIPCVTEKELLSKFLNLWIDLDPTIIVGYNSDFFDIPYLYFRIKKILGDDVVLYLSPIQKISDNIYNSHSPITIGGVNSLDYMLLVKKYIMKEEPSYKLNDIGIKYAKLGKIEYNGSLDKLFKDDPDKFIEYNLRDVEIIEELEKKLQFIKLTILICHLCHVPYESIYYNTVLNEGAILTYLKRKGVVSPNKPTTTNKLIKELNVGDEVQHQRGTPTVEGVITYIDDKSNKCQIRTKANTLKERSLKTIRKKDSYAGGFLLEPTPGLYSYVSDADFTSLYPSIIKSLNLGIETLMGRIITKDNYEQYNSLEKLKQKDPNATLQIEKLNTKNYKLKQGEVKIKDIIELIEENNWSISASGAFYRNDKKSISCEVLEDWFKQREHYRELKKQAGKKEDWENYKLYDLYQLAFKILQNALYGTYAINGWRYTDGYKICSASITNSGQRLTKESITFINSDLEKTIGNGRTEFVIASDTDSAYIELKDLLDMRYPDLDNEDEKIKKLIELSQELIIKANNNLDNISKQVFNIQKKHYFELKQEVIVKKAYWSGKRRYAMWIVNKEGVPIPADHKDAMDMKGLDIMKSNFPPLFRDFGEELIKKILFDTPKNEIDKFVLDFRKSLELIDWKKLLKPTGLKKLDEYIDKKPSAGEIFSKLALKCPVNTKAAIYANDLIRFKKVDKSYSTFQVGDKMYIAYLKENPYRIDVLGLNGYNDPPEILEFVEKYIDKNQMFESVIKNKLENLYLDLKWGMPIFNSNVNKFFSFG